MKKYIKEAIAELQNSDKLTVKIKLQNPTDYKKNFLRIAYNTVILTLQTRIVPSHLKNALLRTTGMQVGYDVCVPHYIQFDPHFPELIYLDQGCLVGGISNLITHQIKDNVLTVGKVILEERTMIGGDVTLLPGTRIRKNSMVMFFSEVQGEIPEGQLWGGKPAVVVQKFTKDDIEKFFKPSNGQYKEYYREFKQKLNAFMNDPSQTYFKIHYNGNRLNAGDDWWRARNWFRIWYNGGIIELTRLLPHCWLKTMLLRLAGVKIGKNCYIGKRVVFDHIYCDNITLEDNVTLEDDVYLDGHEYTITQTVFGKTLVKSGVIIKRHSFVRIGSTIGENTIIEPDSFAQREIPANEVWSGIPAKFVRKR